MASQAIEKVLKCLCLIHRVSYAKNHSLYAIYNTLKKNFLTESDSWVHQIDRPFLQALDNIYRSRYLGDCPPGYNFVVIQLRFLAELDYTFCHLERKIKIIPNSERNKADRKTPLELLIEKNDQRLMRKNHITNRISKEVFLNQNDFVKEFKIMEEGCSMWSVEYATVNSYKIEKLNLKGFHLTDQNSMEFVINPETGELKEWA